MHSDARLYYHFVWGTWDRQPLLAAEIARECYALICHQCSAQNTDIHALGGVADHVHLLASLPRTLSIAAFMKTVKGRTAYCLNEKFASPTWAFKWQGGYGVYTVSMSHVGIVRQYIENQKAHHANGTLWPACERADEKD